ncbi:type II secretion system protein GspM [Janthinobacterium sp. RB2R34]|uniref:type II secretion system protein GspM n=1 Tax=Janthinobacterium sp. RB2R34 TaxID=3424193 RepID=UPI003F24DBEA
MQARLKQWALAYDALSLRERGMLLAAAVAVVMFVFYFLLLNPMLVKRTLLTGGIAQKNMEMTNLDKEITLIRAAHESDPDRDARARLATMLKETDELRGDLRRSQHGLVAPERMVSLLENLLRQHARLRLVSLRTLPVEAVGESVTTPATPPVAGAAVVDASPSIAAAVLHRHGVEVVVQGSYADMVAYMQALQTMPTSVFWGQAQLDAQAYPAASLTLTLHTLSTDESWMAL